jgi:Antirepressor regulating drug resistance, predicted signal transduction N-terminal membrane component
MLDRLFLQILNMSFNASVVILFVLFVRILLKKAPKVFSYSLWSVVLFRLICPFSFESIFSLLPTKANPISQDIVYAPTPKIDTGVTVINNVINWSLPAAAPHASVNPLQVWVFLGEIVWLAGIVILLSYNIISLLKLQKRLKNAVCEDNNIYIVKQLDTPFVMGIFRPRIYLPDTLSAEENQYILLHEKTHIRHFDHVVKLLSFFVLCLHWFNPLVWAAFFISGRDMEMTCDEAVIKQLGNTVKKEYSSSLLALATGRRTVGGTPLAFGEGDTKSRIKNILNYKKPGFWVVIVALIVVVGICAGLMADPITRSGLSWEKPTLATQDIKFYWTDSNGKTELESDFEDNHVTVPFDKIVDYATGDCNNDGKEDIVILIQYSNSERSFVSSKVYLSQGNNTFDYQRELMSEIDQRYHGESAKEELNYVNERLNGTPSSQNPFSAYKDVLQNKIEFITTTYAESGTKTIYLDQLLKEGSETYKFLNFAVLDMDGDEVPEIVIQYCLTNDYPYPDYVEVLHYSDGTVYGYNFSYRGLYSLKNDGTFNWSNGADDNGYAKLRFISDNWEYDNIAYCKPNLPAVSYFIDGQTVTESKYQVFIKTQDDKKDAIWYDFTEGNIENQLSTN